MGIFSLVSGFLGGASQKKAATKAANAQVQAAQMAIDEQRRQYDTSRNDFQPYMQAGTGALDQINQLLGISTPGTTDWAAYVQGNPDALANWNAIKGTSDGQQFGGDMAAFGQYQYNQDGARRDLSPYTSGTNNGASGQQSAINALESSPLYSSLIRNGEQGITSNAAATGGLRGGNIQGALANFRADTLSDVIQQQLANLGGVAGMGQGATGSVAGLGANAATNIGNSMTQQGTARAQSYLTKGGINAANWNNVGGTLDSALSAFMPGGGGIKSLFG